MMPASLELPDTQSSLPLDKLSQYGMGENTQNSGRKSCSGTPACSALCDTKGNSKGTLCPRVIDAEGALAAKQETACPCCGQMQNWGPKRAALRGLTNQLE